MENKKKKGCIKKTKDEIEKGRKQRRGRRVCVCEEREEEVKVEIQSDSRIRSVLKVALSDWTEPYWFFANTHTHNVL